MKYVQWLNTLISLKEVKTACFKNKYFYFTHNSYVYTTLTRDAPSI